MLAAAPAGGAASFVRNLKRQKQNEKGAAQLPFRQLAQGVACLLRQLSALSEYAAGNRLLPRGGNPLPQLCGRRMHLHQDSAKNGNRVSLFLFLLRRKPALHLRARVDLLRKLIEDDLLSSGLFLSALHAAPLCPLPYPDDRADQGGKEIDALGDSIHNEHIPSHPPEHTQINTRHKLRREPLLAIDAQGNQDMDIVGQRLRHHINGLDLLSNQRVQHLRRDVRVLQKITIGAKTQTVLQAK